MVQHRGASLTLRLATLLVGLLAVVGTATATTVIMPADDDLIIASRAIIRGRVLAIGSRLDENSGRIFTYITVRVQEVFKGQITEQEVVLKEEGGQVGTAGSTIFGTPKFEVGERVFLYLDTWRDGSLRVHDMFLGKFSIIPDPRGGGSIVVRDTPDANTTVIDGASVGRAPQRSTSRANLDSYIAMVQDRVRATRRQAREFERTYYTGAAMLMRPTEFVSARAGEIEPHFVLFPSGTPARWFEADDGQSVTYTVNTDGAPPQVLDDISTAMNAWSTVPGCSLRLVNAGADGTCYVRGLNTLVFNNCDGQFAPGSGCIANILAIGGLSWDSSQRKTINGTTFNRANTGHISFNPNSSCDFAVSCQLREIATHELGHTVGLGHTQDSSATMFAFIHYDGRCASLKQDDINAIVFTYPATNGGALAISSGSPLPNASLNTSYSQALTATGGTTPYAWTLVDGQGSLPAGLTLSAAGVISGSPTAPGTSNFTVQVADAANRTAQKAFALTVSTSSSGYDAQFVSQSVPQTVTPGQSFIATIHLLNSGSHAWDPGSGFKLESQNPPNNVTWGGDSVIPAQNVTQPGQPLDLSFQALAPRTNGIYNFQWQTWQQGVGFFGQKSDNMALVVSDGTSPSISSPSSVDAPQGTAFNLQLAASGGVPPYTWSITSGALPDGLSMSAGGMISGTASTTGSVTINFQVRDAVSKSAQKSITINVVPPPPAVATASVSQGEKNKPYSFNLIASGGKPPYRWALVLGSLPAGLSLSTTGVLTGTPTVDGSFDFTVEVTDAEGKTARKALTLIVQPPPLVIETPAAFDVGRGSQFSLTLSASGGRGPYTFAVTSGALPAGLSLNPTSGVIAGVPTVEGSYSAVVGVRDQVDALASTTVQIRVLDPASIPVITKVKYKPGKGKLIVTVRNLSASAVLKVDGVQVAAAPDGNQFSLKHLGLSPGLHQIVVVNPGPITSQPASITVE